MKIQAQMVCACAFAVLGSGCAGKIGFYDAAGHETYKQYCEPVSYIVRTVEADCKMSDQIVSLPGEYRYLKLKPGFGSSNLSVGFNGCLITQIGQQTDREIPQTITALSGAVTAGAGAAKLAMSREFDLADKGAKASTPCSARQEFFRLPISEASADLKPDFIIEGVDKAIATSNTASPDKGQPAPKLQSAP